MSFRPPRSLPILTLFHSVKSDKSRAALALLQNKQKNARGDDTYKIDIIDHQTPTDTQLKQVASFLQSPTPWKDMIVDHNANNAQDAIQAIQDNPNLLNRPIVVDWQKGKAAIGSRTLDTIEQLIKQVHQ
ncbi:uncharacterized protein B0P05DRAFT_462383 [Gilbertella persicaria]|uniref:Thioredoxin-like fold domain-containing protein n=1 Tax=Rhizopus stolonifer TaxID=4846 RepID=A0A367KPK9_RHIST|nr:uncharacterized protein B0P05DRAFT_462383 [Gilbertella persicaria]KAI8092418.1 hypothetical protein B0P05DRAFT_462383 [Gilbertella persicaria]RCI04101.1 hypothetical protein CU098_010138 [Rhizopus stolonifer]